MKNKPTPKQLLADLLTDSEMDLGDDFARGVARRVRRERVVRRGLIATSAAAVTVLALAPWLTNPTEPATSVTENRDPKPAESPVAYTRIDDDELLNYLAKARTPVLAIQGPDGRRQITLLTESSDIFAASEPEAD